MNALECTDTVPPKVDSLSGLLPDSDASISPSNDARLTTYLRLGFRLLAVALGVLHAYANRHLINPDGLSYLDLATGDGTPNGYWSPLYPWLLGAALRVLRPSAYMECAVAHAVNVGLFLVSLVAFEFLLSELLRAVREARARLTWDTPLPDWAIVGLGYALFTYTARRLVTVSLITPDMLVAAGVYAGCAILLLMRRSDHYCWPLVLGIVLGVGFLAKAVFFLLAFMFLALALLCGRRQLAWKRFTLAAGMFALLASLMIAPLSLARGKWTYGESGRLNYLWYVQKVPRPERLAEYPGHDPLQLVVSLPESAGTYSLWLDPSLSFGDLTPRVNFRAQIAASASVASYYFDLLTQKMAPFTGAFFVLVAYSFFARPGSALTWLQLLANTLTNAFCCLVPGLAGLGIYLFVGHAEGRLIGPFLVVVALALLSAVRLSRPRLGAMRPLAASLLAFLGLLFVANLLFDLGNAVSAAKAGEGTPAHPHAAVAEELRRIGVQPGEAVGSIGFTYNAYWARLARVPIRAEIPEHRAREFWMSSPKQRQRALERFRSAGIRVVVSDQLPAHLVGWERIGGTSFGYRWLDR